VILESELAIAKIKGKTIEVFKTNLDNRRNKINLLDKKLDKKRQRQKILKKRTDCSSATVR
jgi:hypothetical protein